MADGLVAQSYLTKAEESLASAESDFAAGRYNSCANRVYYACFQAAITALLRAGVGPSPRDGQWRHDAVQAQFVDRLVNRCKEFPPELRDTLERLMRLRQTADYEPNAVPVAQVERAMRRGRAFVDAVPRKHGGIE